MYRVRLVAGIVAFISGGSSSTRNKSEGEEKESMKHNFSSFIIFPIINFVVFDVSRP